MRARPTCTAPAVLQSARPCRLLTYHIYACATPMPSTCSSSPHRLIIQGLLHRAAAEERGRCGPPRGLWHPEEGGPGGLAASLCCLRGPAAVSATYSTPSILARFAPCIAQAPRSIHQHAASTLAAHVSPRQRTPAPKPEGTNPYHCAGKPYVRHAPAHCPLLL